MELEVVAAERLHLEVLRNLMQLYIYDFSEIDRFDVEESGRFDDRSAINPLEAYWVDPWRSPFLIRVDVRLAGFALVHHKSRLTGAEGVWDMAEFFVLRKYRRSGVGAGAARRLFSTHPGPWEVRQRKTNTPAIAFWRKTIAAHTGGRFTEEELDDDRWRGPVQRFTTGEE